MTSGESSKFEEGMRRQGSVRRVLHNDCVMGVAARTLTPPFQPSSSPVAPSYLQEYAIISEYNMVCDRCIPGLYVIPSAKSALVWFGVVFVREGPFKEGIYRFTLLLPEEFPTSSPPKVICEGRLWHPNVDEITGEVELGLEWKKDVNYVWEALTRLSQLLRQPDTSLTPRNPHALNMYKTNMEEFDKLAVECVKRSRENLFNAGRDDDPHYLRFEQFQPSVHGPALSALTSPIPSQEEEFRGRGGKCKGLSWVRPGSLRPFSKLVS